MTSSDARFVDLYDRFYRQVYSYCRRRISLEDVDDVVAETFLIAWRKIDLVPRGSEVLPWLYGVAYRVIGNQWRGTKRRRKLHSRLARIGYEVSDPPPHELLVNREDAWQARMALDQLNSTDQEILRLSAWEELPQADIAVTQNISIEAVRQRVYQAKKNLLKAYDRLEGTRSSSGREGGVQ